MNLYLITKLILIYSIKMLSDIDEVISFLRLTYQFGVNSYVFLKKCHGAPLVSIILLYHYIFFVSLSLAVRPLDGCRSDLAAVLDGALQRLKLLGTVHQVLKGIPRSLARLIGLDNWDVWLRSSVPRFV